MAPTAFDEAKTSATTTTRKQLAILLTPELTPHLSPRPPFPALLTAAAYSRVASQFKTLAPVCPISHAADQPGLGNDPRRQEPPAHAFGSGRVQGGSGV